LDRFRQPGERGEDRRGPGRRCGRREQGGRGRREAQPAWAALDIKERGKYLHKLANRIRERADELLRTEVVDTGNTITKMKVDISGAAEALEWYTGLAIEMKARPFRRAPSISTSRCASLTGWARIVPFNHPLSFAVRGSPGR